MYSRTINFSTSDCFGYFSLVIKRMMFRLVSCVFSVWELMTGKVPKNLILTCVRVEDQFTDRSIFGRSFRAKSKER